MHLSGLSIRHFRNLAQQQLSIPPQGVAIIGENAQGKTNFLEAVYYLETFRSFRGTRDHRLVSFGEDVFRIVGTLEGTGRSEAVEVTAAYQKRGKRKKITVDGREPDRLSDGLGRVGAVVFSPGDVALIGGGPGERRRFLDITLSLNVPGYLAALQTYRQILGQRNAALKDGRGGATVRIWDQPLVESGARVVAARNGWVDRWKDAFRSYYRRVSGTTSAHMEYRPGFILEDAGSREAIQDAFHGALRETRERETRLGSTVVGPQRDDLRFLVAEGDEGRDLREYGSGGQRRTAALALRLVEGATLRDARGQEPVILLDDIFAELDPGRSRRILGLMEEEETGQVLVTVPKESDIRLRRDSLPRWRIRNGLLES